jgi:hypothetical protein
MATLAAWPPASTYSRSRVRQSQRLAISLTMTLSQRKRGSYIVNTARGAILDPDAAGTREIP